MKKIILKFSAWKYKHIWRPIFFLFDSETIHDFLVSAGELVGYIPPFRFALRKFWRVKNRALVQRVAGITFPNPVGLAAGFDYRGKLTQVLPSIGFGFGTIGTITNRSYEGNPGPRMGRLIKSRSLLVNKGFKNDGIDKTLQKLANCEFQIPIGISIGKTNSRETATLKDAVLDIVSAFKKAESSAVPFSYYELNISCPNLFGNVTFYPPENLRELLAAVSGLRLQKPVFIKMPISESDADVQKMLEVAVKFPIQGVIFGNLQKDRSHPALLPEEVARHGKGNFSGKPTEKRSNELIRLAYKNYGRQLVIIGCGGIFSAADAYRKIKNGATLVELISGMVFEGPQLPAEINLGLLELLKKDGFKNISEAIGTDVKQKDK